MDAVQIKYNNRNLTANLQQAIYKPAGKELRCRDVQRMLERQGLTFLKGPFGEYPEHS